MDNPEEEMDFPLHHIVRSASPLFLILSCFHHHHHHQSFSHPIPPTRHLCPLLSFHPARVRKKEREKEREKERSTWQTHRNVPTRGVCVVSLGQLFLQGPPLPPYTTLSGGRSIPVGPDDHLVQGYAIHPPQRGPGQGPLPRRGGARPTGS